MQKFVGKLRKSFRDKKGFTLIELIVVIAIIGILVLLAAPKFLGYTKDAKVATMQADAKVLSNAALMYNIDNETWPVKADSDRVLADVVDEDDLFDVIGAATVYELEETALGNYVKNTKNPISEYVLVIDGDNAGEVFHLSGVENSKGVTQFSVETIKVAE